MNGKHLSTALMTAAPELLRVLQEGADIVSGIEAQADNLGIDLSEIRAWWQNADVVITKAGGKS